MDDPRAQRFAFGGEFELDCPVFGSAARLDAITHGLQGTWSASGRSALGQILRLLQGEGVDHVHLPAYLCDSILLPVRALGLNYSFYPVDDRFVAHPDPPNGSAVLLIHYFGKINEATKALRAESGSNFHLVEDACQALLSDWHKQLDTRIFCLISPRKFGPALLGGWCNIHVSKDERSEADESESFRSLAARLLKAAYHAQPTHRIDESIEQFYLHAFKKVEERLDRFPLDAAMPEWVLRMIAGIDWPRVARGRLENYAVLSDALGHHVETPFDSYEDGEVPLGHVISLSHRDKVREKLAAKRAFCPVHWRLPKEVSERSFASAHTLSQRCLTLPVDQRYTPEHMSRLAGLVKEFV